MYITRRVLNIYKKVYAIHHTPLHNFVCEFAGFGNNKLQNLIRLHSFLLAKLTTLYHKKQSGEESSAAQSKPAVSFGVANLENQKDFDIWGWGGSQNYAYFFATELLHPHTCLTISR